MLCCTKYDTTTPICSTPAPTLVFKYLHIYIRYIYNICKWAFKRFDCKSIKFSLIAYGTYDIYKRLRLELHLRRLNVCFSSKALIYGLTGCIIKQPVHGIYSTALWPGAHCSPLSYYYNIYIHKQFMYFSLFTQSWRCRRRRRRRSMSSASNVRARLAFERGRACSEIYVRDIIIKQ